MGLHHVAYATRDLEATHRFYEDLMGFPLVHAEQAERPQPDGGPSGHIKHVFYDIGDGECIAFFYIQNMGEKADYSTDLSATVGLPVWVNHVAVRATPDKQETVRERMAAADIEPLMEVDHGWCHSLYFVDPNGIMVELCRDTSGIEPDPSGALDVMRSPLPSGTTA